MRESEVEKTFVDAVRKAGGIAFKFTSQTMNGVPDRLVLLLGARCAFVELKAPGKQMRPLQRKRRKQIEALGFPVFCVDKIEQIEPAIEALMNWKPGEDIPEGIGAKIPEIRYMTLSEINEVFAADTEIIPLTDGADITPVDPVEEEKKHKAMKFREEAFHGVQTS